MNGRKYDPEREHDLVDWILSQTDNKCDSSEPGKAAFGSWLKDAGASADSDQWFIRIHTEGGLHKKRSRSFSELTNSLCKAVKPVTVI